MAIQSTLNNYYNNLAKNKSNSSTALMSKVPLNYTPVPASMTVNSSKAPKPSYKDYSKATQSSPVTPEMFAKMGKEVPYDVKTYNPATANKTIQDAFNESNPKATVAPVNQTPANSSPYIPTSSSYTAPVAQRSVEDIINRTSVSVPNISASSIYNTGGNQASTQAPVTTKELGTGSLTKTEMLSAGNMGKLSAGQSSIMDILKGLQNPSNSEIDSVINNRIAKYKQESDTPIDEETVRKSFRDRIQGQLDAINQTYSSLLANTRLKGENNKGINRAINARSGMLGSTFGASTDASIDRVNSDVEKTVEAERLGLVSKLMSDNENDTTSYLEKLRGEKLNAQDSLMETLQTRETRSAGQASKLAQALLAKGVDLNSLSQQDFQEIQTQYGIDPANLVSEMDKAQYNRDTQQLNLNKNRYQNISDGVMMYDTLTGKMVENTKNFAPSTNSGLNSVLGTGGKVGGVEDAMQRIANVESRGSKDRFGGTDQYQVVSVPSANGDRAYGKYQVMGSNIPVWTKEVLGQALTIDQYLNSPQAQDAVAKAKLQQAYDKHGSWEDSASVWFSGRPLAGNNSKDILGTSTPAYVQKFLGGATTDPNAERAGGYINAIKNGRMTLKEVIDSLGSSAQNEPLRNSIISGLAEDKTTIGDEKTRQALQTIDETIADLEKNQDYAGGLLTNLSKYSPMANSRTNFTNSVNKLTGQLLRLDGVQLKAIFGPQISNADAATIKEIIGNALNPYTQTPEKFQQSLSDIKRALQSSKSQYDYQTPAQADGSEYNYERDMQLAQQAIAQGADQQQVMARFNSKYK